MKILIVDDSKSVHRLLEEMLDLPNLEFQHVYNGLEAISAIKETNFQADLILLDWEMPELSGIDTLPIIIKNHPNQTIFMMTTKNSMPEITDAMQKGAKDYIIKPFTKDIIIGKINSLLEGEY
ncbi:response regulator [Fluviispira multicolorata]|uniref:Response regulator n=1 Tax=Fluviispira multicolorata TaxID=2654512 RepID=A0A833N530_9BACT|nr:response regulator [Fluviispira multicolorata]KAB8029777.1 response regulator [Fluviispira multicolorata]